MKYLLRALTCFFIILVIGGFFIADASLPSSAEITTILNTHNSYRSEVGSPSLTWSNTLASGASSWADHLGGLSSWPTDPHSHTSGVGENIAAGYTTWTAAVNGWGSEKQYFIYGPFDWMNTPSSSSTTGNWMDVGHYTQVVWYDTQQCGCGIGNSPVVGPIYVCQYSPQGNFQGVYPYPAITWSSPGGSTLSSIAMDTNPSTGDWFAVVRGTDNHLYFNKYVQTTKSWGGWTPIGGTTNDEPAVVFTSSYFHVVIRGADNVLYHKKLNAGTNTWDAGWTRVGGHTYSAPGVIRKNWGPYPNDEILLVVRGTDNQVYTNQFTGTSWAAWMSWGGTTSDRPSLAYTFTGSPISYTEVITVGVRGADNKVYTRDMSVSCGGDPPGCGAMIYPWTPVGMSTLSPPAIFYRSGVLQTVVRGTDNHIYYKNGSNPYTALGGTTSELPAVYSGSDLPFIEVSIRGTDAKVYDNTLNTGTGIWTGWTNMKGSTAGHPTISRSTGSKVVLGIRGTNNCVYFRERSL